MKYNRLKRMIKQMNFWTQQEIARHLKIDNGLFSKILNGEDRKFTSSEKEEINYIMGYRKNSYWLFHTEKKGR